MSNGSVETDTAAEETGLVMVTYDENISINGNSAGDINGRELQTNGR